MYYIGRVVAREQDGNTRTTIYITDESVKPIKHVNAPLYMLKKLGYRIINTISQGGNSYLVLEKVDDKEKKD